MSSSSSPSKAPDARASRYASALQRAGQALRAKRPDEAQRLLEELLATSPDEPRALNLLGLAYFKLGQLSEASRVYEGLVRRFPREASLFVNLGLVRLREANLDAAESAFRSALERAPDHRRSHCYLGLVLYRRGDVEGARRHFLAGDAHDFARRVDRLSSARDDDDDRWIRDVSAAAEAALSADVQPFRTVDPGREGRVRRDDRAWRASVEHHQSVPLADPADPSSLRAGMRSMARAPSSTQPSFRMVTMTSELDALARAAEDVAPEPPELVFSLEAAGRTLLTGEEVDTLETGLGRSGFVAGPGGRAKLTVDGEAGIRSDGLVLVIGRRDLDADPEWEGWLRLRGPSVALLSVPGVAVALQGLKDAVFRPDVLRGWCGGLRRSERDGGALELLGSGTALIASTGVPLAVPLAPDREVLCAQASLLAWSTRASVVAARGPKAAPRALQVRGPGWILVSEARER